MDWPNLILNTGTLVAAGTAAVFSYLGYKQQGKQKIAEFRQQWIENFRVRLAAFNGDVYRKAMLQEALQKAKTQSDKEQLELERKRAIEEAGEHYEYLKLCLNPNEANHLELVNKLLVVLNGGPEERRQKPTTSDLGAKILKSEWERLKSEIKH